MSASEYPDFMALYKLVFNFNFLRKWKRDELFLIDNRYQQYALISNRVVDINFENYRKH